MAKRFKTKYPGVFYIVGQAIGSGNKEEKIFYIRFRKDGKLVEEKAGRQFQDDMTPARAARIRSAKIEGKIRTKEELREEKRQIKWTVGALWQAYLEAHPKLKSLRTDKSNYNLHIKPSFEDKRPSEISPFVIDKLRVTLLKEKAPQTVKHVLALLRRIIQFGVNLGLCEGLSFQIKMPKLNNQKTEDLSPKQLSRLLDVLDSERDIQVANMMRLVLYTGMRKSELLRLEWGHIDFQRGFVRIVDPKGGEDQTIPLNGSAKKILEKLPETSSVYVFPGRSGGHRKDIARSLNRIKKAAQLPPGFRPMHGLRHVYASILASSGQVDMYTLQKLLTHKSPQMTQRYAHLRDDVLKKAADLVGDLVKEQQAVGSRMDVVNND